MIEAAGNIEIVEEIWMLSHTFRVMLGHEFERLSELVSAHHFPLSLHLTDHVLELVVD